MPKRKYEGDETERRRAATQAYKERQLAKDPEGFRKRRSAVSGAWQKRKYEQDAEYRERKKQYAHDVANPKFAQRLEADPLLQAKVRGRAHETHRERQLKAGKRVINVFRVTFRVNEQIIAVEQIRALNTNTAMRQIWSKDLHPEATSVLLEQL